MCNLPETIFKKTGKNKIPYLRKQDFSKLFYSGLRINLYKLEKQTNKI